MKVAIQGFFILVLIIVLAGCAKSPSAMLEKITWLASTHPYGSTAVKIQTAELTIYVDPVDLVNIDTLPPADVILLTHFHGDHFSPATIGPLLTPATVIITPDLQTVQEALPQAKTALVLPGKPASVNDFVIDAIPAYGCAAHPAEAGGLGYLFTLDGVRCYISGDTGPTPEALALSGIDIAVLNVRKPYGLSGQDVVEFAIAVKPQIIVPIHWLPENDEYGDSEQIAYIREHLPSTSMLSILDLK
ncbi:MAG: MBL fold metallo-hydrolase [Candidatus Neomarinimicrobiota bacterium]